MDLRHARFSAPEMFASILRSASYTTEANSNAEDVLPKKRELELAIENCKALLTQNLSGGQDGQNKTRQLVRELIDLRRQLHDFEEGQQTEVDNLSIGGHRFAVRNRRGSLGARNQYCDKCGQMIWGLVQIWYKCKLCGFYCHQKCLNNVQRACASVKASEEPVYESTICPEQGLASQKYRCADCKTRLNIDTDNVQFPLPRLCDYSGLFYCPVCHWNDSCVIPARVIRNWDFEPRNVSRSSKQFLRIMQRKPVLLLEALNPHLFNYMSELRSIKAMRQQLQAMKPYLLNCREASSLRLLALLKPNLHFLDSVDAYCVQDLIDLNRNTLESHVSDVIKAYEKHIKQDCEACRGNGFICEICADPEVLFPFDNYITLCRKCKAVFHRLCYEKNDGQCPRCQRRTRRLSVEVADE